ncbi:MAG: hypothetical protein JWM53_6247 [bacterium]|nr:hypothetical protein [bacterium]
MLIDVVVPLLEFAVLGVPLLFLLSRGLPAAERQLLMRTVLIGYALRLGCSAMFVLVPETRVFHEDASGYEAAGRLVASGWLGEGPPIRLADLVGDGGHYPGFLLLVASLYTVLGSFQMVPTAFTSLCGAITIVLVYRLTARSFHHMVAHRAAVLVAYFPSMILWSAMALKDPVMMLLITIVLSAAVALRKRVSPGPVIAIVAALAGVYFIRFYISYVLLAAIAVSLVVARGRSFIGTFYRQLGLAIVIVTLLSAFGLTRRLTANFDEFSLERVNSYRYGMAITANSAFAKDADVSTTSRALAFLPIGAGELLLGPFPWQMTSLRPLLTLPEMLVWWTMLPAVWRGLRFATRNRFGDIVPILIFGAMLTTLYALTLGNVGAVFRQRAQVFVFLFIFAAIGRYLTICRERGIDRKHLLSTGRDA